MAHIRINLFGVFQIWLDENLVNSITSPKIQALLAFLAVESDRMHSRDSLCALLWPDSPEQKARQNLRQSLSRLLKALNQAQTPISILNISRDRVGFNRKADYVLDLDVFTTAQDVARSHEHESLCTCVPCCAGLESAIACYRGDFLTDLHAASQPFDEWIMLKREWLRREALDTLGLLAECALARDDFDAAYRHAWRQIELDPLREESYRMAMTALAHNGQAHDALTLYNRLQQLLDLDLNQHPEGETTTLADAIHRDLHPPSHKTQTQTPQALFAPHTLPLVQHTLPPQFTPFVGREDELKLIAEYVAEPSCHLLTLLGPGGVGKTRLAVEAARNQQSAFREGVCFVSLVAVTSAAQLVTAVAHAVGFTLPLSAYTLQEQQDALIRYLRTRSILLVLDNYEHLLPDVELIMQILQNAPELMLLVTSRAPLGLRAQWILELEGLPFPPERGPARALTNYAAVQLFTASVARIKPGALRADLTSPSIARICTLVQGIPLAIELAAARVDKWSVDEVADAIAQDLDFLSTSLPDVPDRHRSLRAVIDHSWRLLSMEEQRIFAALSIFRGVIACDAALSILQTEETMLARLVAQSLLRQVSSEHYQLHEMLRQYASEKLEAWPHLAAEVRQLYTEYFLTLLSDYTEELHGGDVPGAQATLYVEIDNLRAAWAWAVDDRRVDLIERSATPFFRFFNGIGLMQEGETAFEMAIVTLSHVAPPSITALLLCKLSRLRNSRGHFEPAAVAAKDAYTLLMSAETEAASTNPEAHKILLVAAEAAQQWGRSLLHLGRFDEADGHLEQAMSLMAQIKGVNAEAVQSAVYALAAEIQINLGTIAGFRADYTVARAHDEEGLRLSRQSGDRHLEAITLNNMGSVAELSGRIDEAIEYFEDALTIFQTLAYRRGIAGCLSNLGAMISWRGELTAALERHADAVHVSQEIGDIGGEGWSLMAMGSIYFHLGQLSEARRALQKALELNREGTLAMDTWVAYHLAQVALGQGHLDEARLWIEQSLSLATSLDDEMSAAEAELLQGRLDLRLGNLARAQSSFERALAVKQKHEHRQGEVEAQLGLAVLARLQDDADAAHAHVDAALTVPDTAHLLLVRAPVVTELGRILMSRRAWSEAEKMLQQALELRRQMEQPHYVAEVQALLAKLYWANACPEAALKAANAAHTRLMAEGVDGVEDPIGVFLNTASVLAAVNDSRHQSLIERARVRLKNEAASLADPAARARVLTAMPSHRRLKLTGKVDYGSA